jgi:hypothetical protein
MILCAQSIVITIQDSLKATIRITQKKHENYIYLKVKEAFIIR